MVINAQIVFTSMSDQVLAVVKALPWVFINQTASGPPTAKAADCTNQHEGVKIIQVTAPTRTYAFTFNGGVTLRFSENSRHKSLNWQT